MNTYPLGRKLIEIDQAIGREDKLTLLNLVLEAEDYVLQMQREYVRRPRPAQSDSGPGPRAHRTSRLSA